MPSDARLLPAGFEDLEGHAAVWGDIPDQEQRYRHRRLSTMADLRAFYDAAAPRMRDAFAFLDGPDRDPSDPAADRLFRTMLGMIEAAQAVEIFGQPDVPWRDGAHEMKIEWIDYTKA